MDEKQIKQAISTGKYDIAIEGANALLTKINDSSKSLDIFYMLAVAKRLNGETEDAIKENLNLLKHFPNYARSHQELGFLYKQLQQFENACNHFYQATKYNPALISSWKPLTSLYQQLGNTAAVRVSQARLDHLISLPTAVVQASDLMHEGKLYDADKVCRQFLQNQKHNPHAMTLLAEIGVALKVYAEAEFLLESCMELHPQHVPAGLEYCKLMMKLGRFKQALETVNKLLKTLPDHLPLLTAKATALVGLSDIKPAIEIYQDILANDPQQAGIQLLLGHAYKAEGKLELAIKAYQHAYRINPEFGDAFWSLANTKTYRFSEAEVTHMLNQIQTNISLDDNIHMNFALGKAYEDKKEFGKSFIYYNKGNTLKQQQTQYSPQATATQVKKQKSVFTSALFNKFQNVGSSSVDPIFIVGLPRAGSTLLEQILASHSQIDGTMELHNIIGLVARLRGQNNRFPEIIEQLNPEYFERFGDQFIRETMVYRQGAPLFIDKMPNNFMFIGLIKLILPNAKIIDARREPMACCFSGFKQLFGDGQEFTYGLENIAHYYKCYLDMMSHWNAVLPGYILKVQHENVIDNLEGEVRRMLDFCGLEFEQSCVDFHKTQRTIKTPSSEQVRQPIFKDSMQQWKNYDSELAVLKEYFDNI